MTTGLVALTLVLAAPVASAEDASPLIRVGKSEHKPIALPCKADRIAVGDPKVFDVHLTSPREVLGVGVGEGRTTLLVWCDATRLSYTISVLAEDPERIITELRALLGPMEGITLKAVGDRVLVEGETETVEDEARLVSVLADFPKVRRLEPVVDRSLAVRASHLQNQLRESGFKNLVAQAIGQRIFVEGTVEDAEALRRASAIIVATMEPVTNNVRAK